MSSLHAHGKVKHDQPIPTGPREGMGHALREIWKVWPQMSDLFPVDAERARKEYKRMADFRRRVEQPFIRNKFGLWCPQCGEQIADWEWVGDCDCCGYPSQIEDYDNDEHC